LICVSIQYFALLPALVAKTEIRDFDIVGNSTCSKLPNSIRRDELLEASILCSELPEYFSFTMISRKCFPTLITSYFVFITLIPSLASFVAASDYKELERISNQSLLWGPYRPNLYFGVRPRIPKSFLASLLWARVEDYPSVQNSKFSPLLSL